MPSFVYKCLTRREARRRQLTAEMDAIRAEGVKSGFSDQLLNDLWDKRSQLDLKLPKDEWPALEGKRCRWLTDPSPDESKPVGVIETLEPIPSLEPVEGYDAEHNIQHWFTEKDSIELDPRQFIKAPQLGHTVKNHGAGQMQAAEVRDIAASIYEKLTSSKPEEQNAAARLRMLMNEEPLGIALENDKDADWAADLMTVTRGPVPKVLEKALLSRYGYEADPESVALSSEDFAGKYPTLDKIPGWTPQNTYIGTRKDYYYSTSVVLESWENNTQKHARTFTIASATFNLGTLGIQLSKGGDPSGILTCNFYAGTPAAPGALLFTSEISLLELMPDTLYNYHPFAGVGNPQLANGGTYFYELSTTAVLNLNDHIHINGVATGGVAGNQNWVYTTGGGWASNVKRSAFLTTDCSSGGWYQVRTDVAGSALFSAAGPKGAPADITDNVDIFMGATLTLDDNRSLYKIFPGQMHGKYDLSVSTAGPNDGYRYGFVVFAAGVQINWNTAGGLAYMPGGADASSLLNGLTISGTEENPTVFTNKTDGVVWADTYAMATMYYVGYLDIGYLTCRAFMGAGILWNGLGYYNTDYDLNLGHHKFTQPFYNLSAQVICTMVSFTNPEIMTKNVTIEEVGFDATGATKSHSIVVGTQATTNGQTGTLLVKQAWIKQAENPGAGNFCKMEIGTLCRISPLSAETQWFRPHWFDHDNQLTQQGPPAVPTWPVTVYDNETGRTLYGTLNNPGDYGNDVVFEIGRADTMEVIGRFAKAEYVANGNKFYTWPVLTDGVSAAVKIRTTVDFVVFSDWSTESNSVAPSHSGWDWPERGEVWDGATVDGQDGLRVDADPDLVLEGSSSYGDPGSPLVPNYPVLTAQDIRDAMKLAPTAGAPEAGSIDAQIDSIELVTGPLDTTWEDDGGGGKRFTSTALSQAPYPAAQDIRDALKLAPTAGAPDAGSVDAILASLAAIFTGLTSLPKWLRGLYRKSAMDATAKSEINDGGGTFDEATDSLEAQQEAMVEVASDASDAATDAATAVDNTQYLPAAEAGGPLGLPMLDGEGLAPETPNTGDNLDAQVSTISAVTDKLATMLEAIGIGPAYRFLAAALSQAPAVSQQDVRDSLKKAPSAGEPEPGSIDALIAAAAKPGDEMDLVGTPNAEAVTAIQSGLALDDTVMKAEDYVAPANDGIAAAALAAGAVNDRLPENPASQENVTAVGQAVVNVGAAVSDVSDQIDDLGTDLSAVALAVNGLVASMGNLAAAVAIVRVITQGRLEFDLEHSLAYRYNDAGALAYTSVLTDKDGADVTANTSGPINMGRWEPV